MSLPAPSSRSHHPWVCQRHFPPVVGATMGCRWLYNTNDCIINFYGLLLGRAWQHRSTTSRRRRWGCVSVAFPYADAGGGGPLSSSPPCDKMPFYLCMVDPLFVHFYDIAWKHFNWVRLPGLALCVPVSLPHPVDVVRQCRFPTRVGGTGGVWEVPTPARGSMVFGVRCFTYTAWSLRHFLFLLAGWSSESESESEWDRIIGGGILAWDLRFFSMESAIWMAHDFVIRCFWCTPSTNRL